MIKNLFDKNSNINNYSSSQFQLQNLKNQKICSNNNNSNLVKNNDNIIFKNSMQTNDNKGLESNNDFSESIPSIYKESTNYMPFKRIKIKSIKKLNKSKDLLFPNNMVNDNNNYNYNFYDFPIDHVNSFGKNIFVYSREEKIKENNIYENQIIKNISNNNNKIVDNSKNNTNNNIIINNEYYNYKKENNFEKNNIKKELIPKKFNQVIYSKIIEIDINDENHLNKIEKNNNYIECSNKNTLNESINDKNNNIILKQQIKQRNLKNSANLNFNKRINYNLNKNNNIINQNVNKQNNFEDDNIDIYSGNKTKFNEKMIIRDSKYDINEKKELSKKGKIKSKIPNNLFSDKIEIVNGNNLRKNNSENKIGITSLNFNEKEKKDNKNNNLNIKDIEIRKNNVLNEKILNISNHQKYNNNNNNNNNNNMNKDKMFYNKIENLNINFEQKGNEINKDLNNYKIDNQKKDINEFNKINNNPQKYKNILTSNNILDNNNLIQKQLDNKIKGYLIDNKNFINFIPVNNNINNNKIISKEIDLEIFQDDSIPNNIDIKVSRLNTKINNKLKYNNKKVINQESEPIIINNPNLNLNKNLIINKKFDNEYNIISNKNNLDNNINKTNINKEENIPIINLDLKNPKIKIQFINHNIYNYNMLKEINFLEKLKCKSDERYSLFIKEFQKDKYFMEKNQFENIFIDEKNININSPLTLIFYYIFNPNTIQAESGKNFFETIFTKRGDQNYSMVYNKNDLNEVPKYFNDLNYVNNLFNNFNKNELISFLEEIKNWKKIFKFEQKFKYTIKQFKRFKNMNMRDVAQIYFISPIDLIVDYHSYGSNYIMADFFVAITQYRFHCDINFNIKKGKFEFKTSGIILNTIKLVKKTLLERTIIDESNKTNKAEIQNNIWPYFKNVIKNEDNKNYENIQKIFENHLKYNLNKYSKEKKNDFEYEFLYKNEESKKDINNINYINNNEFNLNNNINTIYNINIKEDKEKSENINEEDLYEINTNNNLNIKNISKENKNINEKKYKVDIKNRYNKKYNGNNNFLKYGVFFVFTLFIIRIILSIIRGNYSLESIFYILLIFVIGYILIKLQLIHKNK